MKKNGWLAWPLLAVSAVAAQVDRIEARATMPACAGGSLHLLREPLRASRTYVDALRAALLAAGAPA